MERKRTHSWNNPLETAEKVKSMSGLDFLKKILKGDSPSLASPIETTLDFHLSELENGKAVFVFEPQEFHYNPIGSVHGGVISTMLDSAMGCTIQSALPHGTSYTTLELKVNFLRPVTKTCGQMKATGKIIHLGRKTALVEANLKDDSGKVYAHGVSTCMIFQV
ncbi:MAG: PaaI family thioesterase [Spirosomataceae bacterium]